MPVESADQQGAPPARWKLPYLVLAYACIGLGAAGIFLPLLPTTPFLLVAAWAASRSSPRLNAWLHGHPRFGPILCAWRDEGAVPKRAKWLACTLLLVSWTVIAATATAVWLPLITGAFFVCVAAYVCTRPSPTNEGRTVDPSGPRTGS